MKKLLLIAFCLMLFASVPAFAANYYITGWDGNCTAVDRALDPDCTTIWMLGSDSFTRDIVADHTTFTWALMRINYSDYSVLANNPLIFMLPVFPFDGKMSAMGSAAKNSLSSTLGAYGINCSLQVDAYRDVIRCIGQTIQPTFTEVPWGN